MHLLKCLFFQKNYSAFSSAAITEIIELLKVAASSVNKGISLVPYLNVVKAEASAKCFTNQPVMYSLDPLNRNPVTKIKSVDHFVFSTMEKSGEENRNSRKSEYNQRRNATNTKTSNVTPKHFLIGSLNTKTITIINPIEVNTSNADERMPYANNDFFRSFK
jgi:hypothetical protein